MSYFNVLTLGCKLNIYESEAISFNLEENGYTYIDDITKAKYLIVNTCSVTLKAAAKSRNIIRSLKFKNPNSILIVSGCLANTEKDILKNFPEIDILVDNKNKSKILEIIKNFERSKNFIKRYYCDDKDNSFDYDLSLFKKHSRAFIKIQDGCNNFCSYCQIPLVRGKSRSRNYEDIVKEIYNIQKNGYKEVVVTGISIGSYFYNGINFSKMLFLLTEEFKNLRFRISSIELFHIDDLFYEVIKKENICNHFHIPLQSGSNKIIKLMNRNYTIEEYYDKISKIRKIKDNPYIATDLIIGFPDESEKDFLDTLDFLEKIRFSYIHVFGFSPRKGTKAFDMKPKIAERIRNLRIQRVIGLRDKMNLEYRSLYLNKSTRVVLEKQISYNLFTGKSDNYLDIVIESNKNLISKEIYEVKITKVSSDNTYGILNE